MIKPHDKNQRKNRTVLSVRPILYHGSLQIVNRRIRRLIDGRPRSLLQSSKHLTNGTKEMDDNQKTLNSNERANFVLDMLIQKTAERGTLVRRDDEKDTATDYVEQQIREGRRLKGPT